MSGKKCSRNKFGKVGELGRTAETVSAIYFFPKMLNMQFLKFTLLTQNTLQVITTKLYGEVLPQTFNQKLIGTYMIFVVFSSILRQELRL